MRRAPSCDTVSGMSAHVLDNYEAFLIDIDGVLVRGTAALPGAAKALSVLSSRGRAVLLTNNSTRSREQHAAYLRELGFEIDPLNILPSSYLAAEYLRREYGALRIWTLGEDGLREELQSAGHRLCDSPEKADVLVVGMDRGLTYDSLAAGLDALRSGARLIATNEDGTYPVPQGLRPGAGAMVGALRGMGFLPDAVIGKPSPIAYDLALRHIEVDPQHLLMIGDRLETDIAGGLSAGIDAALVLSGISTLEDVDRSGIRPTWVVDDIAALVRGEATRADGV